jgi:hypothetical protein
MIDYNGYVIFETKEEFMKKYEAEYCRYGRTPIWWETGFDEKELEKDSFYPMALHLYVPDSYYERCRYYPSSVEEAISSMLEECETGLRSLHCRQNYITNWFSEYQNKNGTKY